MRYFPAVTLSVLANLGLVLVGVVLTFAGIAKAIEPAFFVSHLKNLRLLDERLLVPAAAVVIVLQVGLGAALLLRFWPAILIPAAMVLLLALASLGYWSTATGRTADCGCYNGVFTFSPLQSLLLDAGYAALLGFSWWSGIPAAESRGWRSAAVLLTGLGAGGMALGLLRYSARHKQAFFDLSPIRAGRRWRPDWLPAGAVLPAGEGETLVVFLGATCPHCLKWMKVLNTLHALPDLPSVQGVVTLPNDELEGYRTQVGARFPLVAISPWVATRLSRNTTPTAVLVEDGIIREKWVGSMPKEFKDRLRATMPALRPKADVNSSDIRDRNASSTTSPA